MTNDIPDEIYIDIAGVDINEDQYGGVWNNTGAAKHPQSKMVKYTRSEQEHIDSAADDMFETIRQALQAQPKEVDVEARLINREKNRLIGLRDNLNTGIENLINIEISLKNKTTR